MTQSPLEERAIAAALETDWQSAINLNKEILKEKKDLEAWNRLGRAYSETGQLERAKSSYREVLKLDPYNSIALKNLERLKAANGRSGKITGSTILSPDLFLESPGKTKVLELGNLAKPEIIASLHTGDKVKIEGLKESLRFSDASGSKIGEFVGETAGKLSAMLTGGNIYEAYVQSATPSAVRVFVREVKKAPKFAGTTSFPNSGNSFKPYVHEGAVETLSSPDNQIAELEESEGQTPAEEATKKASLSTKIDEETEED